MPSIKRAFYGALLFFAVALPSTANASIFNANVDTIYINNNGTALVQFAITSGTLSPQTCSGNGARTELAITLTTEGGRGILSALLAAKLAGKSIQVATTTLCSITGQHEDIQGIKVL